MKVVLAAGAILAALLFSGCDALTGGPRKLIINEVVCLDVAFLRMNLGEETEIVLDNTEYSDPQEGMALNLDEFPVRVTSDLPPGSQVGSDFTTIRISVPPGEKTSFTVEPFFTGQFTGQCNISISDAGGGTIISRALTFEIVDN